MDPVDVAVPAPILPSASRGPASETQEAVGAAAASEAMALPLPPPRQQFRTARDESLEVVKHADAPVAAETSVAATSVAAVAALARPAPAMPAVLAPASQPASAVLAATSEPAAAAAAVLPSGGAAAEEELLSEQAQAPEAVAMEARSKRVLLLTPFAAVAVTGMAALRLQFLNRGAAEADVGNYLQLDGEYLNA
eukprot:TRINITY_DN39609_c0_g1_i1.p1 TRINITY_DN39609_c0_g1~~TRINITY_DN39609_c0_g1_i1.p1  ORF type:complete len:195 (+),score=45.26 TRINITY_DN39609_c0_g1_i1:243-827(+)